MFAIVFDLDVGILEKTYGGPSWTAAYPDVRAFLKTRGFGRQNGNTCFGDETVDAVSCVLAIQDLTLEFDWFASSVRDLCMLRIEDESDLMPAVRRAMRKTDGRRDAALFKADPLETLPY